MEVTEELTEQEYHADPVKRGALAAVGTTAVEMASGVIPGAADGAKSGGKSGALMLGLTALALTALVAGPVLFVAAGVGAWWAAGAGAAYIGTATFGSLFAASLPGVIGYTALFSGIAGAIGTVAGAIGGAGTGAVTGVIGGVTGRLFGGIEKTIEGNQASREMEAVAKAAERQGYIDAKYKLMEAKAGLHEAQSSLKQAQSTAPSAPTFTQPPVQIHVVHTQPAVTHQVVRHDADGHTVTTTSVGAAPVQHNMIHPASSPQPLNLTPAPQATHTTAPVIQHNTIHEAPVTHEAHAVSAVPVTVNVPVTNELHNISPVTVSAHADPVQQTRVDPIQKILKQGQQGNNVHAIIENRQENGQNDPVASILKSRGEQPQPIINPAAVAEQKALAQGAAAGGR